MVWMILDAANMFAWRIPYQGHLNIVLRYSWEQHNTQFHFRGSQNFEDSAIFMNDAVGATL